MRAIATTERQRKLEGRALRMALCALSSSTPPGWRACWRHSNDRPIVICIGLIRPRIALSVGALAQFPPAALRAAVAHEEAHRQRRDPLRLLAWRLLCCSRVRRWLANGMCGSSCAEVRADAFARRVTSRAALASALYTMMSAQLMSENTAREPASDIFPATSEIAITSCRASALWRASSADTFGERLRMLSVSEDTPLHTSRLTTTWGR